jgi:hypothetical protein
MSATDNARLLLLMAAKDIRAMEALADPQLQSISHPDQRYVA